MQQRAIESDAQMVRQTILLLCEGGVKSVTLEAVGRRAGYSRGLVTRRYGSKDQLLIRVLDYLNAWCVQSMRNATMQEDGIAAIFISIRVAISCIQSHPENYRALFILWAYGLESNSIVKAELVQLSQKSRAMHRSWLIQAQEAGDISLNADLELILDVIISQSIGLFNQWLLDPDFRIEDRLMHLMKVQLFLILKYESFYQESQYWGA
ncbi:MAG: TetR/AcrR family transcriptional regulator [Acinetobacter sp.]